MKNFKLNYIEEGKMSNNEMSSIVGGSTSCSQRTVCPKGETSKNFCGVYKNCPNNQSKDTCSSKSWVLIPAGFDMDAIFAVDTKMFAKL
jgi:hypothetical protein